MNANIDAGLRISILNWRDPTQAECSRTHRPLLANLAFSAILRYQTHAQLFRGQLMNKNRIKSKTKSLTSAIILALSIGSLSACASQSNTTQMAALQSKALSAPDVAALQKPSERVGKYVEVDGARIFYEMGGKGPVMLLLHGYPLSGALFSRVRESLESDYTVITVDHRGYGLSKAPGIPDSIEVYASDALGVLDRLGFDKAIIGGMSMGGPITLSMYQTAPERFTGMILIDTTAAAAAPPEAGLWLGVEKVIAAQGLDPVIKALLPDMLTGETRLSNPAVGEYLREVMLGATIEAGRGGALALAQRPDFTSLLGKIKVPTLIIVGAEDSLYPIEVSRGMHEKIANSSLAIVPGGSHATIFEAPGLAAAAIRDWAKTLR